MYKKECTTSSWNPDLAAVGWSLRLDALLWKMGQVIKGSPNIGLSLWPPSLVLDALCTILKLSWRYNTLLVYEIYVVNRLQALRPEWSGCDVTTLKIRSEDGNHIYILKMSFSETIGHLRQHLDKHRCGGLRIMLFTIVHVCGTDCGVFFFFYRDDRSGAGK